jgi:hypothetical protein
MLKEAPDHRDADLVIKLYDLRREPVMRESRNTMIREFWPRTADELLAVLKPDHPLNRPYRQTSTYWEMVYGMARHGIVHADFLAENSGEGLFLFARVEPFLPQLREATSPRVWRNAEWITSNCEVGRTILEHFRERVKRTLAAR